MVDKARRRGQAKWFALVERGPPAIAVKLVWALIVEEAMMRPTDATLLNNEEVHRAFQRLKDASEGLNQDADRFDDDNWREVVPDVNSAAAEVSEAADELEKVLGYKQ